MSDNITQNFYSKNSSKVKSNIFETYLWKRLTLLKIFIWFLLKIKMINVKQIKKVKF